MRYFTVLMTTPASIIGSDQRHDGRLDFIRHQWHSTPISRHSYAVHRQKLWIDLFCHWSLEPNILLFPKWNQFFFVFNSIRNEMPTPHVGVFWSNRMCSRLKLDKFLERNKFLCLQKIGKANASTLSKWKQTELSCTVLVLSVVNTLTTRRVDERESVRNKRVFEKA